MTGSMPWWVTSLAFDTVIVSPDLLKCSHIRHSTRASFDALRSSNPDGTFKDVTKEMNLWYPDSKYGTDGL